MGWRTETVWHVLMSLRQVHFVTVVTPIGNGFEQLEWFESMPDFLLEIGCEEIPARMIDAASRELRDRVAALLTRERLSGRRSDLLRYSAATLVMASGVAASQDDVVEQMNGPSVNVAYKDGQPTPAAQAFAKKAGVDVSNWSGFRRPRANTSRPKSRRRVAARRRFSPTICQKRLRPSTGRKICTGESRASASCVRFGGWWRCSMGRRSRSNLMEFERETITRTQNSYRSRGDDFARRIRYVESLRAAQE